MRSPEVFTIEEPKTKVILLVLDWFAVGLISFYVMTLAAGTMLMMLPRIFSWTLVPACIILLCTSGRLTSSSKSLRRLIFQWTVYQFHFHARNTP